MAHQQLAKVFAGSSTPTTHQQQKMKQAIAQAAKVKTNLPKPAAGTDLRRLYDASFALRHANIKVTTGLTALTKMMQQSHSPLSVSVTKLATGATTINANQTAFLIGIKQIAQKQTLQTTFRAIKRHKNTQLSRAFSHTYLAGALIVLCLSPVALWTDRRRHHISNI